MFQCSIETGEVGTVGSGEKGLTAAALDVLSKIFYNLSGVEVAFFNEAVGQYHGEFMIL